MFDFSKCVFLCFLFTGDILLLSTHACFFLLVLLEAVSVPLSAHAFICQVKCLFSFSSITHLGAKPASSTVFISAYFTLTTSVSVRE